jgi:putative acetyltransferase
VSEIPAAAQPTLVRDARDDDSWDLIGLIAACWSDYPGCVLDVHGESTWLRAPASSFAERQGRLWVAEEGGRVVGSVGILPADAGGGAELRALYVARSARRRGLGGQLVELVEAEARRRRAAFIELWTDTRFVDAHRLYERCGYQRGPASRELHDLSNSIEYYYRKALIPGG